MKSLFEELKIYGKAYCYCEDHGECRELEDVIATDGFWSFRYARDVVGSNFKFGEESIAMDAIRWDWYQEFLESL